MGQAGLDPTWRQRPLWASWFMWLLCGWISLCLSCPLELGNKVRPCVAHMPELAAGGRFCTNIDMLRAELEGKTGLQQAPLLPGDQALAVGTLHVLLGAAAPGWPLVLQTVPGPYHRPFPP